MYTNLSEESLAASARSLRVVDVDVMVVSVQGLLHKGFSEHGVVYTEVILVLFQELEIF